MPSMRQVAKMGKSRVYRALQTIINSRYYGMTIEDIKLVSGGYNNACRYLHELVLVNDLNKSDLYQISEKKSSDERSRSSQE